MKLQKLTLKNYKGINDFTFEPDGQSATVWGANESGKTTLFDALTWLLTGKDSRDRSPDNFGIKTRGADGEVIHGLDHQVEGEFDCFTLRRVYQEKWTRKRGAANETFSGHTTDYFIDDEPVKASDYQETVGQVMPEQLLKILTMPDFFPEQMHWKERREVLFDLVGEIDTEDIILNYGDLERYPTVLDGKTHEAREKILKEQRRKLDRELDNIPDRVDEVSRMIEDVAGVDEARKEVENLKAKKETIEAKRNNVKSGGRLSELKVEKQEMQAKVQAAKNEYREKISEHLAGQREKVSELQDKVDEAESDWREDRRKYEKADSNLKDAKGLVDNAEEELEDAKKREPKPANAFEPKKCPVCEQTMPDAEEHDYEAYLEEFNQKRVEDIKNLTNRVKGCKYNATKMLDIRHEAEKKAANSKGKLSQRKQALSKAFDALNKRKNNQLSWEGTDEYKALCRDIEQIDQKIANHRQEKQCQLEKLDNHIADLNSQIEQAQSTILQAEQNKKYKARIQQLQEQRKGIVRKLEQAEADLHLMEEFVRARSAYVTDRVNEEFEHVTWKLFEEQINGGISETCTAVFKGVPFDQGLNNAGRIQAGLDIISTLSKHYGKKAPVIIDNAESITDIPDYDLQIIALVVTPGLNELHVERGLENHLEPPEYREKLAEIPVN